MNLKLLFMRADGLLGLAIVIALCIGEACLLLLLESQLALFLLLVLTVVLWFTVRRVGLAQAAGNAVACRVGATNMLVCLGIFILILIFREEHYALLMIGTVLLFTTAGIGLNIQTGLTGLANFAGASFFASGGYTMVVLVQKGTIPHELALLAGGAISAFIGILLLLPVLRTRGYYSALVTIAFGLLFSSFLQVNEHLGGSEGLQIEGLRLFGWDMSTGFEWGGGEVSFYFAYCVLAILVFLMASLLAHAIEWSAIGVNLDATRNDELVSSTFGISTQRWKITAFLLGNFVIGVAGALYSGMTGFISPAGSTFEQSLLLISIIVLGGIGNTWGTLIAATFIISLPEKLHALQEYRVLLFSVLVVIILMFSPKGLVPRTMRNFSRKRGIHE